MTQWVYNFGKTGTDGDATRRNLLGGKGANLAEMSGIGLPVPPGFTLSTGVCTHFYDHDKTYPDTLYQQVRDAIAKIESETGTRFADSVNPLLVSVRSGARASMPGMMDTILNLGLNDKTVKALAKESGNAAFAYDCYRRFIQMYGDVVMGVQAVNENDHCPFEGILEKVRKEAGVKLDNELTAKDLKELIKRYKAVIKQRTGTAFPQDAYEQLWGSVSAVFNSWQNERATLYRQKYLSLIHI